MTNFQPHKLHEKCDAIVAEINKALADAEASDAANEGYEQYIKTMKDFT